MGQEATEPEVPEMELEIVDLTEAEPPPPPAPPPSGAAQASGGDAGERAPRRRLPSLRGNAKREDIPGIDAKQAKAGPPTADEWQKFIGGTVLRALTEGYLHLVLFRDIDESELTPRERDLITLERSDLLDIAAPMASFAGKSKVARKHGRVIIAAGESYEAFIDLFIWMRRVNKIAKKYRVTKPVIIQGVTEDGVIPQPYQQTGEQPGDERANQSPPITGIYNPGTG